MTKTENSLSYKVNKRLKLAYKLLTSNKSYGIIKLQEYIEKEAGK